jgi:penicillin-binding protein 2
MNNKNKPSMKNKVKPNIGIARFSITIGIMILMFLSLIVRLYELQILNEPADASGVKLKSQKIITLKSARGNIYDRNGKPLAYNRAAYAVTLKDMGNYKTNRIRQLTLNRIAYNLVSRLMKNHEKINNELKIMLNEDGNYEYTVTGTQLQRFKADIFGKARVDDMTEEEAGTGAEDIIEYLASSKRFGLYGEREIKYTTEELKEYQLKETYNKEETLGILGIRYMLSLNTYQKYVPVTIAKDVSEKTIIYVKENENILTGAEVETDWVRVYDGGEAFAHILGYTGPISEEELSKLSETNADYTIQSSIGKTGLEQYLEDTLKGKDGRAEVSVDMDGKELTKEKQIRKPEPGEDVYVSLDKDLQTAVYHILEQHIAGILISNITNAKEFDKSAVRDASDIKIPVYDVYFALVNNEVINLTLLNSETATEFERGIYKKIEKKKAEVLEEISCVISEGTIIKSSQSEEMQDYENFITDKLTILTNSAVDKMDPAYIAWTVEKNISIHDFFSYALRMGWIDRKNINSKGSYFTMEESCKVLAEIIAEQLKENRDFDKLIFKYLLRSDEVSGEDTCRLLYEQGILSEKDEDYKDLMNHRISGYSFILKKIGNLQITPASLALDPYSGSAVVVEAATGKVLASVSYPGYDNNRLANQMDVQYYNRLYRDLSIPLFNRATGQLMAPGSTFKPVTVIAGLKEGVIGPDTTIFCDGIFDKVVPPLRCWKHYGHGEINGPAEAIEHSCNDYLGDISYRLGLKGRGTYSDARALSYIRNYAEVFNLDKKSGIEIAESEPNITDRYAIPSAIGQGTHSYNTVQLARYVNTLATKGTSYKLSLIKEIKNQVTGKLNRKKSEIQSRVDLPPGIWEVVDEGMQLFAENNTELKDMKITVAGKSGTAQESARRPDHALFIGYAPAQKPEISVVVRIANGYASGNAVGTGRDIFNYYFKLEKKEDIVTGKASQALNHRTD